MSVEEWTKVNCRQCGEDMTEFYHSAGMSDDICSHECDCIEQGIPITEPDV